MTKVWLTTPEEDFAKTTSNTLFCKITELQDEALKLQCLFLSEYSNAAFDAKYCYNVTKRINRINDMSRDIVNSECNVPNDGKVAHSVSEGLEKQNEKCNTEQINSCFSGLIQYDTGAEALLIEPKKKKTLSSTKKLLNEHNTSDIKEMIIINDEPKYHTAKKKRSKTNKATDEVLNKSDSLCVEKTIIDNLHSKDEPEKEIYIIDPMLAQNVVVIDDDEVVTRGFLSSTKPTDVRAQPNEEGEGTQNTAYVNKKNIENDVNNSKEKCRIVICKVCLASFQNRKDLSVHKSSCMNIFDKDLCTLDLFEEESKHPCPICSKVLSTSRLLRYHINKCHGRKVYLATCHCCKKHFRCLTKLQRHLQKSTACYLKCKICHIKFMTNIGLRQHTRGKHAEKTPICCLLCKKRFSTRYNLERHMFSAHNEDRPHKCYKCGSRFSHVAELNTHMRVTNCSGRLYSCKKCNKEYHNFSSLRWHMEKFHHMDFTGIRLKASDNEKL